jgi:tetratricopeptide (TPR) repeat protein
VNISLWIRGISLILIALPGQYALAHSDIGSQISSVTRKIEERPNDASLYLVRGDLRRYSHDWPGAEADFSVADQLGSAAVRDQLNLYRGHLFLDAEQFERAIAELDTYIARHPDHIDALRLRALARKGTGSIDGAIADYTQLILLDPARSPELWLERARLWVKLGRDDDAIRSMDEAITIFGALVTLVDLSVDVEVRRHNFAAALSHIDTLPPTLTQSPQWLWRRGNVLEKLNRPHDASRMYDKAQEAIRELPLHRRNTPAIQELIANLRGTS